MNSLTIPSPAYTSQMPFYCHLFTKNHQMKTLLINCLFLTLFSCVSYQLNAQKKIENPPKSKIELGVSYSGNGIGLDVKRHWKDNKYIRLSNLTIGLGGNSEQTITRASTGFNLGIENRKYFSNKWFLSYGPELGTRITYNTNRGINESTYELSLGYFLGINYDITDYLSIGAEIKTSIFTSRDIYNLPTFTSPYTRNNWGLKTMGKVNLTYRF